jgi:hypothetical protein
MSTEVLKGYLSACLSVCSTVSLAINGPISKAVNFFADFSQLLLHWCFDDEAMNFTLTFIWEETLCMSWECTNESILCCSSTPNEDQGWGLGT